MAYTVAALSSIHLGAFGCANGRGNFVLKNILHCNIYWSNSLLKLRPHQVPPAPRSAALKKIANVAPSAKSSAARENTDLGDADYAWRFFYDTWLFDRPQSNAKKCDAMKETFPIFHFAAQRGAAQRRGAAQLAV